MTRTLATFAALLIALPATAQQISTGTLAATTQQNQAADGQAPIVTDVPGLGLGAEIEDVQLLLFPLGDTAEALPASRSGEALEQPTTGLATVQQIN